MATATKTLCIRIPPDHHEALKEIAARQCRPLNQLIGDMVREFLKANGPKPEQAQAPVTPMPPMEEPQ